MRALVAGIHVLNGDAKLKTWMAGTSPAMTKSSLERKNNHGSRQRSRPPHLLDPCASRRRLGEALPFVGHLPAESESADRRQKVVRCLHPSVGEHGANARGERYRARQAQEVPRR